MAKYVTLAHVPITVLAFLCIPHAQGNSAAKYPIFTLQFKDALYFVLSTANTARLPTTADQETDFVYKQSGSFVP